MYRNTFHAMLSVARTEGASALFSGVFATILRDVPFSIVYFVSYESIRTVQQWARGGSEEHNKLGKSVSQSISQRNRQAGIQL